MIKWIQFDSSTKAVMPFKCTAELLNALRSNACTITLKRMDDGWDAYIQTDTDTIPLAMTHLLSGKSSVEVFSTTTKQDRVLLNLVGKPEYQLSIKKPSHAATTKSVSRSNVPSLRTRIIQCLALCSPISSSDIQSKVGGNLQESTATLIQLADRDSQGKYTLKMDVWNQIQPWEWTWNSDEERQTVIDKLSAIFDEQNIPQNERLVLLPPDERKALLKDDPLGDVTLEERVLHILAVRGLRYAEITDKIGFPVDVKVLNPILNKVAQFDGTWTLLPTSYKLLHPKTWPGYRTSEERNRAIESMYHALEKLGLSKDDPLWRETEGYQAPKKQKAVPDHAALASTLLSGSSSTPLRQVRKGTPVMEVKVLDKSKAPVAKIKKPTEQVKKPIATKGSPMVRNSPAPSRKELRPVDRTILPPLHPIQTQHDLVLLQTEFKRLYNEYKRIYQEIQDAELGMKRIEHSMDKGEDVDDVVENYVGPIAAERWQRYHQLHEWVSKAQVEANRAIQAYGWKL